MLLHGNVEAIIVLYSNSYFSSLCTDGLDSLTANNCLPGFWKRNRSEVFANGSEKGRKDRLWLLGNEKHELMNGVSSPTFVK